MNEIIMNVAVAAMTVLAFVATAWAFWLENSKKN